MIKRRVVSLLCLILTLSVGTNLAIGAPPYPPHNDAWFSNQLKSGVTFSYNNSSWDDTYNCLAYALGTTSTWIWPWGSRDATLSEMTDVLNAFGYSAHNPGASYNPPNLVVYGSASAIGHIAKAGSNVTTVSKWGRHELVTTDSLDPYRPAPNGYGPKVQYYW